MGASGAPGSATRMAAALMEDFADRTGLSSGGRQIRYLWTDAFAVCNYLTLFRRTREARYAELAVHLVHSVHHVLGRHREDDPRGGWISGLGEVEGELHPTAGGLRIGKRLAERRPHDAYDARLEWDRDGQYYHYLVRWMHALGRAAEVLGEARYLTWAVELADAAFGGFVYAPTAGAPRHMRWKMSIDLGRPLVASEGAHDPLDGLVASCALRAKLPPSSPGRPGLEDQIGALAGMCAGRSWATDDPLGAGGLLTDACWVDTLVREQGMDGGLRDMEARLWKDAAASLGAVGRGYPFRGPAGSRLAFRELGLAIGLSAVDILLESVGPSVDDRTLEGAREVRRHLALAEAIVKTWLSDEARAADSWTEHEDINAVMLATALAPDEYVRL